MFSDQQKLELGKPLSSAHVKKRDQAGRKLSYIEGWKVIEEANRIFGFDGWTRETIDIKCVSERDREIGQSKTPGHGVSYIAKVRVRVGEIMREGIGAGHGIDRDLGQAHESAIKEAETDAMKRALMTFGWPFGLALYDKDQEHVCDEREEARATPTPAPAPKSTVLNEPLASDAAQLLKNDIGGCVSYDELDTFVRSDGFKHRVGVLPDKHRGSVRLAYQSRATALKERAA